MWLLTAIISLLTTNLIFTYALGTSTMLAASRRRSSLPVLAVLMTVFSVVGCFAMQTLLFRLHLVELLVYPYSLGLPLVFTAVIGAVYLMVLLISGVFLKKKAGNYKKYIHLSAFNCAVMGTLYLAFSAGGPGQALTDAAQIEVFGMLDVHMDEPLSAVLFGLQEGAGFLLASLMLMPVRERLNDTEVPEAFRGLPAVMVYIGILSMAVYAIAF